LNFINKTVKAPCSRYAVESAASASAAAQLTVRKVHNFVDVCAGYVVALFSPVVELASLQPSANEVRT
jgi:hypothetical protein